MAEIDAKIMFYLDWKRFDVLLNEVIMLMWKIKC